MHLKRRACSLWDVLRGYWHDPPTACPPACWLRWWAAGHARHWHSVRCQAQRGHLPTRGITTMSSYIFNILIALDLLLAALVGCQRNETLSAAAYGTELDGKLAGRISRPMIDWLLSWREHDHCRVQYEFEKTLKRNL